MISLKQIRNLKSLIGLILPSKDEERVCFILGGYSKGCVNSRKLT